MEEKKILGVLVIILIPFILLVGLKMPSNGSAADKGIVLDIFYSSDIAGYIEPCG